MKKVYEAPECELIIIDEFDILTNSGDIDAGVGGESTELPDLPLG